MIGTPVAGLGEVDVDALGHALQGLALGWTAFANAAAAADWAASEAWATFTFTLFQAFDCVDPGWGERWTARDVLLQGEIATGSQVEVSRGERAFGSGGRA